MHIECALIHRALQDCYLSTCFSCWELNNFFGFHLHVTTKNYDLKRANKMLFLSVQLCPVLAEKAVETSWQDTPENMQIKTTGNLHSLFSRLKSYGVKIAIW